MLWEFCFCDDEISVQAWNSLPPKTLACCSLLTFRRETKSHLCRQSHRWLGAVYQTVSKRLHWAVLYNSFVYKLYKVLPGLCDGSTIILTFLVVVVVVVVVNDVSFSVSGWVFISTINSRPTCEQQWMSRRMEAPAISGVTRWCTQLHWR